MNGLNTKAVPINLSRSQDTPSRLAMMPCEQADKGLADSTTIKTPLSSAVRRALDLAVNHSLETVKVDGHW